MRKVSDGLLTALLKNAEQSKVINEYYPYENDILYQFEPNLVSEIIKLGDLDKEYEKYQANGDALSQSTDD